MESKQVTQAQINEILAKAKQEVSTKMIGLDNSKQARLAFLSQKIITSKINVPNNTLHKSAIQPYVPTLKANQRAKQAQLFKQEYKQNAQKKSQPQPYASYCDPRLRQKSNIRKKRSLIFNTPGIHIQQGHKARAEERLRILKESLAITTHQTGIATAVKLATIQPKRLMDESQVPEIDWWDDYLMIERNTKYHDLEEKDGMLENMEKFVNLKWISNLIEHPVKTKPPIDSTTDIRLLLTKAETKKLRRQTRAELQKEEQEKIRLGLSKPPVPKVRLSNLMRVLGTEAVQDPTKIEAYVRSQMEQRKRNHETANAQRKLTKEESRAKKIQKLQENPNDRTNVAVYKVKNLTHPSHRFKIEKNANQLFMTGIVALHSTCNVVVVEGNAKKQKKFKRLMLNRIDWNQDNRRAPDTADVPTKLNDCELIWEGIVNTPAFGKIEFKSCPSELYAREQFRKCDVEQYWDLAYSKEVLQAAGELTS